VKRNIVEAVNDALACALESDHDVVVFGEDVGKNGGVFRATDALQDRFGADRVFDTPLAESGIAGFAVGLAAYGLKPVAEIQFGGFLYLAMNQLGAQAARLHSRSGGRLNIQMVLRAPYGGNVKSPDLHSDSFEALFSHTPGLKVVMPSTPYNAKGLLLAAIEDPDPVVFLEPLRLYRTFREEVPDGIYTVPLGEARVAREGSDVTVISYGAASPTALEAAETLGEEGVSAEVVDLQTVSPIDASTVVASVQKTGRAVVVHEAVGQLGVGAEIVALINERALFSLLAPVERVTGWNTPYPFAEVEHLFVPSKDMVVRSVRRTLQPDEV